MIAALAGCSVVNVYEGDVRVKRYWGLPLYSFAQADPARAMYLESRGLGLVTGPTGVSLGYVNETYLAVPQDQCSAVFIKPTKQAIAAMRAANVDFSHLCVYP